MPVQRFSVRDVQAALKGAKRAGIPIRAIKVTSEKGFELIVGEPEIIDAESLARKEPAFTFTPIPSGSIHQRRRRIINDAIAALRAEDHPIGVGTVVDFLTSGKRSHPKHDLDDIMSMGDGIGWREALASLVDRVLKGQAK